MTDFQLVVYKLIAREYELVKFEEWVYSNKELEKTLDSEEYLAIISLNYNNSSSLYEAEEIHKSHIDLGKYYEWFVRRILQKIIDRPLDVHKYIEQCYDLYCNGFGLLKNLGLNYGLNIKVSPSNYKADSWDELTPSEQLKLIGDLYPAVAKEAKQVLYWFDNGKIVITGDCAKYRGIKYNDHRSFNEK